ncbi:beta-glucosidase 12-like [Prunus yedoensis var. nudiflora]|uniref:Beta-glucosidase 12-like n=1 Tax=Prunus yedoensis var. nudiflora TaxID=2094558 RepID=A0A314UG52_PRUYE|nr:beta-glucosidase 12-like [Prunus yedoensis var. nudiflora]
MAVKSSTLLLVLLLVTLGCEVTSSTAYNPRHFGAACDTGILKRSSFPSGFVFGSASSSYQLLLWPQMGS